jgi:hypothetical protein
MARAAVAREHRRVDFHRLPRVLGWRTSHAVLRTPRDEVVRPAGFRSRLFARFTQASHPVLIAAVGAAFAISFDTDQPGGPLLAHRLA